jgi:hypothetical protein
MVLCRSCPLPASNGAWCQQGVEDRSTYHLCSASDRHGISCGDTVWVLMKSRFRDSCCEQKYMKAASSDDKNIDDEKGILVSGKNLVQDSTCSCVDRS